MRNIAVALALLSGWVSAAGQTQRVIAPASTPQVLHAAELLAAATELAGATVTLAVAEPQRWSISGVPCPVSPESVGLLQRDAAHIEVYGADAAGVLYGALALLERAREPARRRRSGTAPVLLPEPVQETPAFRLRGHAMAVVSATSYDQPITRATAPWFYDMNYWLRELDLCRDCRFNALYIWSKHPFPYFLRLPSFPESQDLSDAQLDENIAMFKWITTEAEKRNVTIMFVIYNIFVSHSFAEAHEIPVANAFWSPLLVDYTQECVSQFVAQYPNVSLVICAGEALAERKPQWVSEVILPAVMRTGKRPPIVVRGWQMSARDVAEVILPVYDNLYTESKYNGELLTSPRYMEPANEVYIAHSPLHIVNMHLVSNLNPFRWFDPYFIRECMKFCHDKGARGLEVFPLEFWAWPHTMDRCEPGLVSLERDRLWYEAWGRYSWNPDRELNVEDVYWWERLGGDFGLTRDDASKLLSAMRHYSAVMPANNRFFSAHGGNGAAHTLGQTLPQLMHQSARHFTPERGETVRSFVARVAHGTPTVGEGPKEGARFMAAESAAAVRLFDEIMPRARANRDELERWRNDARAIHAFALHTYAKVEAAMETLMYRESGRLLHLREAEAALTRSVEAYRDLCRLTEPAYLAATGLRWYRHKPYSTVLSVDHWTDVLPRFERELADFRANLAVLENVNADPYERSVIAWRPETPSRLLLYDKDALLPDGLLEHGPWLMFELGFEQESQGYWWADGINLAAEVICDGSRERAYQESIQTIEWTPRLVSLSRWAGRRIALRLIVEPRGSHESEHILWGSARVLSGQLPRRLSMVAPPPTMEVVADLVRCVDQRRYRRGLVSPNGQMKPWGGWARVHAGTQWGGSDARPAIFMSTPYQPQVLGHAAFLEFDIQL
ncbi:hypothetical protein HS125_20375 [bacterium]|nr:hypothetical protein [bacterium]